MKRRLIVALLAIGALTLTGCDNGEPRETQSERIDRLYAACIAAGGSFEYNGSLPYWNCQMPKEAPNEDH